jgi:hypothetical protein
VPRLFLLTGASALRRLGALFAQSGSRRFWQMRDCALPLCSRCCLLDIAPGCRLLLAAGHLDSSMPLEVLHGALVGLCFLLG